MANAATAIDIELGDDGSVVVNLETRRVSEKKSAKSFDANLAESLPDDLLDTIAQELREGIEADERSRSEWLKNYNEGMQLLGLMLESPGGAAAGTVSKVRHPLLLWSIIKFQAMTQGELLPANGPAKFKNEGDLPDGVAQDLEKAFNRYLTLTASEYYPDTDRSLFYLGYGGTIFKKVYKCPIRRRPVSEFVALPDLIVSQDAVDLQSAARVTHRVPMSRQTVLRYQKMKYWSDIQLAAPIDRVVSTNQAESQHVTGIAPQKERQEDWQHTIDECYTTLDLSAHITEKDQDEGIELPYCVTLEHDSRKILAIRRNWREGDSSWQPRKRFVTFGLIPSIGFLCLGYLHLLGNHTKALTALERIIIDSGMFANFPSGVRAKGVRLETNILQPGPGEFPEIDVAGMDSIQKAIMPMPFKGPDAVMLSLMQGLEAQGEKTAGQIDMKTGEGQSDIPVGTIMAMIEQSTQVMTAVHRRLHQAQGEELVLLRDLLTDQPDLLQIPNTTAKWTLEQLASASLVPASNPNVPAHIHRIMQAVVLETLATTHPELYNIREVQRRILEIARVPDIEQVLMPVQPPSGDQQPQQDPTAMLGMMQAKIAEMQIQLRAQSDERTAKLKEGQLALAKQKETREAQAQAEELGQGGQALQQERMAHLENLAEQSADRVSREKVGLKEAATQSDQHAAELESEMNQANLQALVDHAGNQTDAHLTARGQDQTAAAAAAQPKATP